jgi:O-antigen/teichoic acid export membrane protein
VLAHGNALWVYAANAAVLTVQAWFARRWTYELIERVANPPTELRRDILRLVLRQLPNAIFYCLMGQVTLLVVGFFGQAQQVAEVGALGRLSAIFAIVGSVMSVIVCPRFARAQTGRELGRQYARVIGFYLGGAAVAVVLGAVFARELAWILGPKYLHLESMAPWIVLMAACNSFLGVLWSMNAAKGWTRGVWRTIPAIVLAQVALVPWLDLGSVHGAVLFGTLPMLAAVPILCWLAWAGIRGTPNIPE